MQKLLAHISQFNFSIFPTSFPLLFSVEKGFARILLLESPRTVEPSCSWWSTQNVETAQKKNLRIIIGRAELKISNRIWNLISLSFFSLDGFLLVKLNELIFNIFSLMFDKEKVPISASSDWWKSEKRENPFFQLFWVISFSFTLQQINVRQWKFLLLLPDSHQLTMDVRVKLEKLIRQASEGGSRATFYFTEHSNGNNWAKQIPFPGAEKSKKSLRNFETKDDNDETTRQSFQFIDLLKLKFINFAILPHTRRECAREIDRKLRFRHADEVKAKNMKDDECWRCTRVRRKRENIMNT